MFRLLGFFFGFGRWLQLALRLLKLRSIFYLGLVEDVARRLSQQRGGPSGFFRRLLRSFARLRLLSFGLSCQAGQLIF